MNKKLFVFIVIALIAAVIVISQISEKNDKDNDASNTSASDKNSTQDSESVNVIVTDEINDPFPEEIVSSLSANQIFVYDVSANKFLFEKNTDTNIVPASITKLYTALFALQSMPSDTVITPKDELSLVKPGSSIAYINENHRLTLGMLVEGMLLPSGNDAAYVTAAAVGRKLAGNDSLDGKSAVDLFMKKLNEYAASVGCTGTHFSVPDGDATTDHYTTAHDLTIIAKLALKNQIISKYAFTVTDDVTYASGHYITWNNSNQLINPDSKYYSQYATGLKTGSLDDSFSVLSSAVIDDKTYIVGVFDAPTAGSRFSDALELIDTLAYIVN